MSVPRGIRLSDDLPLFSFDVNRSLPPDWRDSVSSCLAVAGRHTRFDGHSNTSRERCFPRARQASATVVDGAGIRSSMPWLLDLYEGLFLGLANSLGLGGFEAANGQRSAVNVNRLDVGERYEWHVDSNPLTGVLLLSTHVGSGGGALVFRPDPFEGTAQSWEVRVTPSQGTLLLFDARRSAHTVEPVVSGPPRISAPMNFYVSGAEQQRPDDLDAYLYEYE